MAESESNGQDSGDGRDIVTMSSEDSLSTCSSAAKREWRGGAAPFVYCGDVQFLEWHGDRPITVRWKLPADVPDWSGLLSAVSSEVEHRS